MKQRCLLSFGFALFLSGPMLWADGDVAPPDASQSYTQPNQQPVNNNVPLAPAKSELDKAGIYSEGGRLFVDRNLTVNTVQISTFSASSGTVTGVLTVPNGKAATDAAAFGQVKIIRISSNTTVSNFTTTANTFQTSNLTYAYATQNTTNSLWILACFTGGASQSGADHFWDLYADTTALGAASPGSGHDFLTSGSDHRYPTCLQGFFTPGVTTSVTYSVKARSAAGVSTVYVGSQGALQTITIVEFVK